MNRGGRQTKRATPNIAAAGRKQPAKPEENSKNGESRGRGRGRGSTRGRGRGRGSKADVIVQSEGTFTAGLSDGVLKANRLNNHGDEEVIGKMENSVSKIAKFTNGPKAEIDDEVKSNASEQFNAFEWASDDDQDKIELYELVKPAFVSDIKKGREMPVVLPQKDETQFQHLVQVTNKFSVKDPMPVEDKKMSLKNSRMSASRIQPYVNEHTNDLMLLQLPASLDVVHQMFNTDTAEEKMEVDDAKTQQPSSSTAAQPPPTQQKHCLDGLPTGVEIGKLQLLKNGQTRLVIGDRVMDIQHAIPSQMFETIVQTQTFSKPKQEPGTLTASHVAPQTGSMTVLGNIGDSFLCTYNVAWDG